MRYYHKRLTFTERNLETKGETVEVEITDIPPGCDDIEIRRESVGLTVCVQEANGTHFLVSLEELSAQLRAAGKEKAARYWEIARVMGGKSFLHIRKSVCRVIETQETGPT